MSAGPASNTLPLKRYRAYGYPSLAAFMASDRDKTAQIYKRFDWLSARNLLYLESELAELEEKLHSYDEQDRGQLQARNWEGFKESGQSDPERMALVRNIREAMLEYKSLLAHESVIASLPTPDRKALKAFRHVFFHGNPQDRNSYPVLGGPSANLYDDADDLLVLRASEQQDRLSMFVQDYLGGFFPDRTSTADANIPSVGYASGDRIRSFVLYLSTTLAALLLIGAIIVLYKVKSPDLKLGLLGLFTFVFAACVGLLTNAKRTEIFGVTAAYAAVLVVFVSGNLGVQP